MGQRPDRGIRQLVVRLNSEGYLRFQLEFVDLADRRFAPRMHRDDVLDFGRKSLESGGDQQPFTPMNKGDVAAVVSHAQITGMHSTRTIQHRRPRRCVGVTHGRAIAFLLGNTVHQVLHLLTDRGERGAGSNEVI